MLVEEWDLEEQLCQTSPNSAWNLAAFKTSVFYVCCLAEFFTNYDFLHRNYTR